MDNIDNEFILYFNWLNKNCDLATLHKWEEVHI